MSGKSIFPAVCLLALFSSAALAGTALQELTSRLGSPDPAVRLDAVRQIAVTWHGEGLGSLSTAASDSDEYVRERAVQALGNSGNGGAVTPVLAAFDDPADFVRWRAVQAAARLGVRDIDERLARLVSDRFWRVRVVTFQLLGEIGREMLVSGSPELASSPAGEKIRSCLLAGLNDSDERARVAAARSLAALNDRAAYSPLVELLNEGSLFTREQAALGLGDLRDNRALLPLIEALEDPENRISRERRDWACWGAAVALEQLTGQDFKTNAKKWRQWLAANMPQ